MLRLHCLTLDHVAGVSYAHVNFKDHGVTVIHGPNEGGKSTFLKAFELLLSKTLVSSSAKAVMWAYPNGSTERPQIRAEMTIADQRVIITKRYHKGSGEAILNILSPRVENLSGREAEERFQEILYRGMDATLRQALTIHQGTSLEPFAPADIAALSHIMGGEDTGDEPLTDSQAAQLMLRVDKEYARYFTKNGSVSKSGELGKAHEAREIAQSNTEKLQISYQDAQQHIQQIEQLVEQQHHNEQQLPRAQDELKEARKEEEKAKEQAHQREKLEDQLRLASAQVESQEQKHKERKEKIDELNRLDLQLKQLDTAIFQARAEYEKEQQEEARREALSVSKHAEREQAEYVRSLVKHVREAVTHAEQLTKLATKVQALQALLQQHKQLIHSVEANPVTAEKLEEFRAAVIELHRVMSVRNAAATLVQIHGPYGATISESSGDDHILENDGIEFQLTSARELTLGEFTVAITPAENLSDVDRAVQRARTTVQILAREIFGDGDTVNDNTWTGKNAAEEEQQLLKLQRRIEQLAEKRQTLVRDKEHVSMRLETTAEGRHIDSLLHDAQYEQEASKKAVLSLREIIRRYEEAAEHNHTNHSNEVVKLANEAMKYAHTVLSEIPHPQPMKSQESEKQNLKPLASETAEKQLGDAETPSASLGQAQLPAQGESGVAETHIAAGWQHWAASVVEEFLAGGGAPTRVDSLGQQIQELIDELDASLHARNPQRHDMAYAREKLITLNAKRQQLGESHTTKHEALQQARQHQSDAELADTLAEAHAQLSAARTSAQQFGQRSAVADLSLASERARGARAKVDNIQNRISEDAVARANLEGQLMRQSGVKEDLDAAHREQERLESEWHRVNARAQAVRVLKEELVRARSALHSRYEKPFKEAFESLARVVFDNDIALELAEDLSVKKRIMNGKDLTPDMLSGGAQEQLLMLARLAVATLVAHGEAVPIMIDDALGFSDPQRRAKINTMLSHLSHEHQIIILTCDVQRFDDIAGAQQLALSTVQEAQ